MAGIKAYDLRGRLGIARKGDKEKEEKGKKKKEKEKRQRVFHDSRILKIRFFTT
jgi:hypothetical protein